MQAIPAFSQPSHFQRRLLWLAFLVIASVGFSLGFACAVPLAAFAAMAAVTLSRRDALLFAGAVWLANQAIGFTVLGYPMTANAFAWGATMGAATLLAVPAARRAAQCVSHRGAMTAMVTGFAAAFVAYELVLYVAAATALGATEEFAPAIVAYVFALNLAGLFVLHGLNRLASMAGVTGLGTLAAAR